MAAGGRARWGRCGACRCSQATGWVSIVHRLKQQDLPGVGVHQETDGCADLSPGPRPQTRGPQPSLPSQSLQRLGRPPGPASPGGRRLLVS